MKYRKEERMNQEAKLILKEVCRVFGLTTKQVLSKSKEGHIAEARFITVYFIKSRTNVSLKTIGKWFNRPEKSAHSFSIYAIKQANDLQVNTYFKTKYLQCEASIFVLFEIDCNNIPQL